MENKISSYSQKWDLNSLFPGESHSPVLRSSLDHLKTQIQQFEKNFQKIADLKKGLLRFQEIEGHCNDLREYITCLLAQNVEDQDAIELDSQITAIKASCDSLGEELDVFLSKLDEETFQSLISDPHLASIAFNLAERRQNVKEKLPLEQERLVYRLYIDGYHGWNDIYHSFMGRMTILSPSSSGESLSVGQAYNRLTHPDRQVRQAWFQQWEKTWSQHEELVSQMLNHLAGFRLNLYNTRGWHSILQEPLFKNRMQEKTLNTMWKAIDHHKETLKKYLAAKAQLLGIEQLAWHDVEAPLPFDSKENISFDHAAQLIIKHFASFSLSMGAFAKEALEKQWIEAEDRSGKRPGGFCAPFTQLKQSRIFMTYSGTMMNVMTLAHELGHAYHSYELRHLPVFAQQYRMNVAETASTLAEMIVLESLVNEASDPIQKLSLLDYKLQRAVLFLMNIQARFLFELDFYQARRKGYVSPKELNQLMVKAQKKAYGNSLVEWHPRFWIAKQHFYDTEVPFYNFPYTFGYLFSLGIYAHLLNENQRDKILAALLQDTGRMNVEDLAYKHLNVKLEEPYFWENSLNLIEKDVEVYLKLSLEV